MNMYITFCVKHRIPGCVFGFRTLTWTAVWFASMVLFWSGPCDGKQTKQFRLHTAVVNLTYKDPTTKRLVTEGEEMGRYGLNSDIHPEHGVVVHVRTAEGANHGCSAPVNIPNDERWIALVQRGSCKFAQKVFNSAVKRNASAVVIYNHKEEDRLVTMDHYIDHVVSIFIHKKDGDRIATLVDNDVRVMMNISVGIIQVVRVKESKQMANGTTVSPLLIVSLCFIVLLVFGLSGLLFYTIRRSRYARTRNRRPNVIFTLQNQTQAQELLQNGGSGSTQT